MLALVPRLWAVLVGCCALLFPSLASANIGPRWWGDLVLEPQGLHEVAIVHEELTIDLRPLAAVQPARVEVIYRLNNPKAARKLELVFVSGTEAVSDFEVWLGERPRGGRLVPTKKVVQSSEGLPKRWLPPRDVPGIGGGYANYWMDREDKWSLLTFTIDLPTGPSVLSVSYRARAAGADEGKAVTTWVFPYVLAPARAWGSFGGLDVTVHVPEGWEASASPELTRDGNVLRGRFEGLPADHLIIKARTPAGPTTRRALGLGGGLFVLSVVLGGALCWWAGRLMGRYLASVPAPNRTDWFGLCKILGAFLVSVLWSTIIFGGMFLGRWGMDRAFAGQHAPYFHQGLFMAYCGVPCLMVVAIPTGMMLTVAGIWRSDGKAQAPEKPAGARPDVTLWP